MINTNPTNLFSRDIKKIHGMPITVFTFNKKYSAGYMATLRGMDRDYTQRGNTEEEAIENLLEKVKFALWERCQHD